MDIVFVISFFPDPRINKRLKVAKEIGNTALIFWDRETVRLGNIEHTDIENIRINVRAYYSNPLRRILPTIKFILKALKGLSRLKPKCIYVTNIDMLLVAYLYSLLKKDKPKIVYEIADLNQLIADEQKGIIKKIVKNGLVIMEKLMCKRISTLVVTSERFFKFYYSKFVPEAKLLFMPNMPNLDAFCNYKRKEAGKFAIGFIGAVRYKKQMKMLINVAEKCDVSILFAGAGLDSEIESIAKSKPNISYHGKYDYNNEISSLYGQVDCVYAVYDADLNNVRIALPNKLYEAIYCELPIIVAKGTYLAELVESMGVGISVSHNDPDDLEEKLKRLSTDKDYYWGLVNNCRSHKVEIDARKYNEKLESELKRLL